MVKIYNGMMFIDGYKRACSGGKLSFENISKDSLSFVNGVDKDSAWLIWEDGVITEVTYSLGYLVGRCVGVKGNIPVPPPMPGARS